MPSCSVLPPISLPTAITSISGDIDRYRMGDDGAEERPSISGCTTSYSMMNASVLYDSLMQHVKQALFLVKNACFTSPRR